MKNIYKYFRAFLAVLLLASVAACNIEEPTGPENVGLGIKVFFPTKVVQGQPMTINGSGFSDVTEIVFPQGVVVTDFEIVSSEMIRVTAPAGIAADGGKILLRTKDDETESRLPLTLGHTSISGFSKQDGESIDGGEQLTIYGEDLEFISSVELLDPDGNPYLLEEMDFYRKGTSSVIITIPKKNIFDGTFIGTVNTYDGQSFPMPELTYKPDSGGGHWETKKVYIWQNDGTVGDASWSSGSPYRFSNVERVTGEEVYAIPMDLWERIKTETFYVTVKPKAGSDWFQVRVVTGWWQAQWPAEDGNGAYDFNPNSEEWIDNGDGTLSLPINFEGHGILDLLDEQHLLFAGDGFSVTDLYLEEQEWVGDGHWETQTTSIWKNDGTVGAASWNGGSPYRFSNVERVTGEEIYAIPMDLWEKMKTEPFCVTVKPNDGTDWFQVRVVTGWWQAQWPAEDGNGAYDFNPNSEQWIDNGDGTLTLEIDFNGHDILHLLDEQHLLFAGDGFIVTELFFKQDMWVTDGDDDRAGGSQKETIIWENDGSVGVASWNGSPYRFSNEEKTTGEEVYAIPMDLWEKIKTETFYVTVKPNAGSDWFQVRVVTGWWNAQWPAADGNGAYDFNPNSPEWEKNDDGSLTLPINFVGHEILDLLDDQHLLFAGDGFKVTKLSLR